MKTQPTYRHRPLRETDRREMTADEIQREINFMRAMYRHDLNRRRHHHNPLGFMLCYALVGIAFFGLIALVLNWSN